MATKDEINEIKGAMAGDGGFDVDETPVKQEEVHLLAHPKINEHLCGEVKENKEGYARVMLVTNAEMVVDSVGLVHSGFIFASAAHAAMSAINDPNAIIVGADSKFLAPIEEGNVIDFEAKVLQKDTKKREVKVAGMILDIKIFEGIFHIVSFDRHVLRLKLTTAAK